MRSKLSVKLFLVLVLFSFFTFSFTSYSKILKNKETPGFVQDQKKSLKKDTIPITKSIPQKPFVVVLDAGHGGKAPGARGQYSSEKDITLAITKKLGDLINATLPDVKVYYTRTEDVSVEFNERTRLANSKKADLFICIHCNSVPKHAHSPQGVETYVLGLSDENRNLETAKRENGDILLEDNYKQNYDGFDPNSPESYIIFSLFQNHNQKRSYKIASLIEAEMEKAGRINRGIKQEPLIVLRNTVMPGILVETGYISNPEEEVFLNSADGQEILARAILQALIQYKNDVFH